MFTDKILSAMDKGQPTGAVFIDLTKAPFTWDRNEVRAEWKSKLPACLHKTGTKWRNTPSRVKPALRAILIMAPTNTSSVNTILMLLLMSTVLCYQLNILILLLLRRRTVREKRLINFLLSQNMTKMLTYRTKPVVISSSNIHRLFCLTSQSFLEFLLLLAILFCILLLCACVLGNLRPVRNVFVFTFIPVWIHLGLNSVGSVQQAVWL